ncbi:hypothetical protein [Novipirellula artificiosorum]|uniref:Uncharacterized protein n=1 Tax=Novipirellula artificiosorum TaxID=2528016 RepID=A0A5C6DCR6_9BACT|nr:hypothetical protein [Novipirellula artificiosorum]TWU33016.1 hypothetical protein Poly41_53950 [Novipirellula artificiosorum]
MRTVSITAVVARFFAAVEVREIIAVESFTAAFRLHLNAWRMRLGMLCYPGLSPLRVVTLDDGTMDKMSWMHGIKRGSQLGIRRGSLQPQWIPSRCVSDRGRA